MRKLSEIVEVEQEKSESEEHELDCMDDDSSDEDWGKNVGKESSNGDSEEVDLEEEEEEAVAVRSRKEKYTGSQSTGKRKKVDVSKMSCVKKFKFEGDEEKGMSKPKQVLAGDKAVTVTGSNNIQREILPQVLSQGESLRLFNCTT